MKFAFFNTDYEEILARVGDEDTAGRLQAAAVDFNDYIHHSILQGRDPVEARQAWLKVNLGEAFVEGMFGGSGEVSGLTAWYSLPTLILLGRHLRGPRGRRSGAGSGAGGDSGGTGGGPGGQRW